MEMVKTELFKKCKLFRQAIEFNSAIRMRQPFLEFPRGSCGETSLLLSMYLMDNGYGNFNYVSGWKDGQSHAWLQQGKLIIDITADQFKDIVEPIIITEDDSWHKNFMSKESKNIDINKYDNSTKINLLNLYSLILSQINQTA